MGYPIADLSCSWEEDSRASRVAFHEQAELSNRPERPTMAVTRTTATFSQTGRPTNQAPTLRGDERHFPYFAYRVCVADASSRPASLAHPIPLPSHLAARWDRERIHEVLRDQLRLAEGRAISPSAAIIDSQSVKTMEKGSLMAMMLVRRSVEESDTSS